MQTKKRKTSQQPSFPRAVPRADKAALGRTSTASTPLAIRVQGMELGVAIKDYVVERLSRKLGKFAQHITRISVRFEDVSGAKGAPTMACRVKTVFPSMASVIVESRQPDVRAAFDEAAEAHTRAVRRMLEKHDRK